MTLHITPVGLTLLLFVVQLIALGIVAAILSRRIERSQTTELMVKMNEAIDVVGDRAVRAEQQSKQALEKGGDNEEVIRALMKESATLTLLVQKLVAGEDIDIEQIRKDVESKFAGSPVV